MVEKPKLEIANEPAAAADPLNVAALRLSPAFEETAGVRKQLTIVPVRKPHRQEWIRVHPDEAYRGDFATIRLKPSDEYYLVAPTLIETLRNELTLVTIYTTINRAGVVFLWAAPRPSSDGRSPADTWHRSAHEAAAAAMKRLTRVTANKDLGANEIAYSDNPTPENDPVWPDLPFVELLRLGFEKPGRPQRRAVSPVVTDAEIIQAQFR
jgi:hypothetical protein